ncbi:DUF2663 family protein [Salipaludibacillus daqingensis]|uniref:DUF2663 family protein n=1 Tax=Salipaludibacillus daqingensis TaxID=3041001 RepID=UPI0024753891|nr:DUF2663 family protein [Salipaludibacillus daqingensis]
MVGKEKLKDNEVESIDSYLVKAIVKAKMKEKKAEKKLFKAGLFVLGSVAGFLLYLSTQWEMLMNSPSMLTTIASDPIVLVFMSVIGISFVHLQNKKFKFEKAEKDYDELKEDMIERASDIWSTPEQWMERSRIFEELKQTYDINLYHK